MIIVVHRFADTHLLLEVKFENDPENDLQNLWYQNKQQKNKS